MVKIPRNSEAKIPLNIKPTNYLKSNLTIPLSNKIAGTENRVLPIIGIDFSNFKKNLIGLNKFEIIELLDKPSFKRTEHPASIWQYQSSVCLIDIFFYSNEKNLVVDHVETRSKNIEKTSEKQCFSSFLSSRYGGGM